MTYLSTYKYLYSFLTKVNRYMKIEQFITNLVFEDVPFEFYINVYCILYYIVYTQLYIFFKYFNNDLEFYKIFKTETKTFR